MTRTSTVHARLAVQATFLYESLWNVGVAALVLWAASRFALGHGRTFALYVAAYTVGRFWTEYLRIDESHTFLGLRLNSWTSVVVFLGAMAYLVVSARRHPDSDDEARTKNEVDNARAGEPRPDVVVKTGGSAAPRA